ncbi:MAG: amidohydrolase family protein [Phycisphaerales bacterium]|nr:amidohydrolase family protein [Phycisphaerales bacterium]
MRQGMKLVVLALGVAASAALALGANAKAFVGAKLIPIDGPEIDRGVLVIEDGKISAVGAEGDVSIPAGAERIDVAGKVIMPGLVDTHSHVAGGASAADGSGPIQPGVRIYDSINPRASGFKRAVAGGLTTLNVMPGSGHLCSGQTVYMKLRLAETPHTIDDIMYLNADGSPMGGLKMANGTNPQGDPPFPGTRGKAAYLVREQYIKAQEYAAAVKRATNADGTMDASKMPARDLDMEALVEVMEHKRVVHHHTHRADDIMTVLRLSKEFGFRVVLHHVSEGNRVADEIAAAGVPVSAIIVDSPGGKLEARNLLLATPGIMERAGCNVALHSDDWITDCRLFLRMAAMAHRAGMTRAGALRSLTLAGAEILDMQDRIGSLAVGKDADFAILDGDPLSAYTHVQETWCEGVRVFDRSNEQDHLYAVGGAGAGHDQEPYLCCYDHDNGVQHLNAEAN